MFICDSCFSLSTVAKLTGCWLWLNVQWTESGNFLIKLVQEIKLVYFPICSTTPSIIEHICPKALVSPMHFKTL